MEQFICVYLILLSVVNLSLLLESNDEFQQTVNRTDLYCPSECFQNMEFVGPNRPHCCACYSPFLWQDDKGRLEVIYNDSIDRYVIEKPPQTHSQLYIINPFKSLTDLPANICNYKNIVRIDFSYNDILNIDGISCVEHLDTLILKGNKIQYLKNTTFLGMKYIRKIDLSYNNLKYIEPGLLYNMDGSLYLFNVSYNFLTSVDVTNLVFGKQSFFCQTDFSHNKIQKISNEQGWICQDSFNLGYGGFIHLSYNNFTHFFNFSHIGFKDLFQLGKLLFYGFDLRENNWICDCQFHPFLIAVSAFKEFRLYYQLPCKSPPEFVGKYIIDFLQDNELDKLICNVSMTDKCPPKCHCFYQPQLQRTVVNCSRSCMRKLPPALPERLNLNVDLSSNQLSYLDSIFEISEKRSPFRYIERIKELNLSRNEIQVIPERMFYILRNVTLVDLRHNNIIRIPRSLQVIKPCQVLLRSVLNTCTSDDLWLQHWLPVEDGECWNNVKVYCMGPHGTLPITNMTEQLLGCKIQEDVKWIGHVLATTCLVIVVCACLLFKFRFEIFILTRQMVKHFKRRGMLQATYPYNVYISCNEDDETLRLWMTTDFVPYLERLNLKVFLPYRDCEVGRNREEEIIEVTSKCLNFIIFLSEKYRGSIKMWVLKEWKYSWQCYKSDLNREIVLVNYDMLKSAEMKEKYLRAFIRLHKYIDFSNHNKLIKENIISFLQKNVTTEDGNKRHSSSTEDFLLNNLDINCQNDVTIIRNGGKSTFLRYNIPTNMVNSETVL